MAAKDVLSFRSSEEMVRAVEERAWAEGVPVSEVLRSAVRVYLRECRLRGLGFVDDNDQARAPGQPLDGPDPAAAGAKKPT